MSNKEKDHLVKSVKMRLKAVDDTTTGFYRLVVELSPMCNNDVSYFTFKTDSKSVLEQAVITLFQHMEYDGSWQRPRLVLIRPVHLAELTDRSNVQLTIDTSSSIHDVVFRTLCTKESTYKLFCDPTPYGQKQKEVTEVFDTFQKVKDQLAFYDLIHEDKPSTEKPTNTKKLANVVAYILGSEYYDCMSGGISLIYINLCYFILNRLGQEVHDTYIYPRSFRDTDVMGKFKDRDSVLVDEFLEDFKSGQGYEEKYQQLFSELVNQLSKQNEVFAPLCLEA